MLECSNCGLVSKVETAFVKVRKRFYCPKCYQEKEYGQARRELIIFALVSLFSLAVLFTPYAEQFSILITIFFFYSCNIMMLALHELGHAVVAKLLGLRIFAIIFGTGKTLVKKQINTIHFSLNIFPFSGIVVWGTADPKFYRLRYFLSILAGPAVHIIFLILLVPRFIRGSSIYLGDSFLDMFLFVLAASNLVLLIVNLYPRSFYTAFGLHPSDGLALYKTLKMSSSERDTHLAGYYLYEGMIANEQMRYQQALDSSEEGLKHFPNNMYLGNLQANMMLSLGAFEEAREIFKQLLEKEESEARFMLYNNLAYANLMIQDESLLAEADSLSKEAFENIPWAPSVRGTRGAVLVELGFLDEGKGLLLEAMAEHLEAGGKAADACHIAIAEIGKGNLPEGQYYIETAEQLDPNCHLLNRAKNELLRSNPL